MHRFAKIGKIFSSKKELVVLEETIRVDILLNSDIETFLICFC